MHYFFSSERSIQAVFSWICMRCVSRSAVGSSRAESASGKISRAVRVTASCPSTSWRIISSAAGTPEASGTTAAEAAAIIRYEVDAGTYLIATSNEVPVGRWAQVNMPWAYRGVMKLLNRGLRWAAEGAEADPNAQARRA